MNEMTDTESNDEDMARESRGRDLESDIFQIQVKEKVLTPTFALLCVAVLMSSLGALGVYLDNREEKKISEDTNALVENIAVLVEDIEERNSPEAIEQRQKALNAVILEVACNDRETLEDFSAQLFEKLIAVGILPEGTTVTLAPDPDCTPPPGG